MFKCHTTQMPCFSPCCIIRIEYDLQQEDHGPHGSSDKQLQSKNKFCYFIIIAPLKRAGPFIWINLNPLHPRLLCVKFHWNWSSVSWEEDENRWMDTIQRSNKPRSDMRVYSQSEDSLCLGIALLLRMWGLIRISVYRDNLSHGTHRDTSDEKLVF